MHLRRALLLASTMFLAPHLALAQPLPPAMAGPMGGSVVAGAASISRGTGTTQVTQSSARAVLDWQQFNVGRNHVVQFNQPNAQAWTLNRVTGVDPSVIAGQIRANGGVAIVNRSGVMVAEGARIDVGSLIASTSDITNRNFMQGEMRFDAGRPRRGARVENRGEITVAQGGMAALVGAEVANSGVIRARLGKVALAGGAEAFALDLAGDGLLSIDVSSAIAQAPQGAAALVTNSGVIQAEGGSVLLTARAASGLMEQLVSHTGRIEAPSIAGRTGQVAIIADGGGVRMTGSVAARGAAGQRGGAVEINGSGTVTLAAGALVDVSGATGGGRATIGAGIGSRPGAATRLARRTEVERGATIRADATVAGQGGEVVVHAAEDMTFLGVLTARGGPGGGDGGMAEISSRGHFRLDGQIDLGAVAGNAGSVLIDPVELRVVQTLSGSSEPAEVTADSVNSTVGNLTLNADNIVRVQAAINKPSGGLAITTNATTGGAIFLESDVAVTGGSFSATTNGTFVQNAGTALRASSDISFVAGTSITLGGLVDSGGTVAASTRGAFIQNAGATLNAIGGVTLDAVSAITLGGSVAVSNGEFRSTASGTFAQSGGTTLNANGRITIEAGRSITLGGSVATSAGAFAALTDGIFLQDGGNTLSAGAGVTITAGGIAASGSISSQGEVSLTAVGAATNLAANNGGILVLGSITSGAGTVLFSRNSYVAVGSESWLDANAARAPTAAGAVRPGVSCSGLDCGSVSAGGLLDITAEREAAVGGSLRGGTAIPPTASAAVSINSRTDFFNSGEIVATGGAPDSALFVRATRTIENTGRMETVGLAGVTDSGRMRLDTTLIDDILAAPTVNPAGGAITNSGTLVVAGRLQVTAQTSVVNSAPGSITARGENLATSANAIFLTGGNAISNTGTITALHGDMLLQGPNGVTLAGALSGPELVRIVTNNANVALTAPVSGGRVAIEAGSGAVSQAATGAGLSAGTLTLAAGSAAITGAGNAIATLGTSALSGSLSIVNGGALVVTGPVSATAQTLTLSTGALTLAADVAATAGAFTATTPGTVLQDGGTALSATTGITINAGGIAQAGTITSPGPIRLTANGAAGNAAANFGGILLLGHVQGGGQVSALANVTSGAGYVGVGSANWLAANPSKLPSAAGAILPAVTCTLGTNCGTLEAGGLAQVSTNREIAVAGSVQGGTITPVATLNAVNMSARTDLINDGLIAGTGGGSLNTQSLPIVATYVQAAGTLTNNGTIAARRTTTPNSGRLAVDTTFMDAGLSLPYANPNGGGVTNNGTITSETRVRVSGQAFVENTASGVITAGGIGAAAGSNIVFIDTAGFVRNAGRIAGTGGEATASTIYVRARAGDITNSGSIEALRNGQAQSGRIRLDTALTTNDSAAPNNPGGGGLVNSGSISAERSIAIVLQSGLQNSGTIEGQGLASTAAGDVHNGTGIFVNAGKDVTNASSGRILGTGGGGTNSVGTISGLAIVSGGAISNAAGAEMRGVATAVNLSGGLYLDTRGLPSGDPNATPIYTTGTSVTNRGLIAADYYASLNARTNFLQSASGSITATLTTPTIDRSGINVTAAGTLVNQGLMQARGGDANNSVVVLRSRTTLTNEGTIQSFARTSGGSPVAGSGGMRIDTTGGTNVGDPAVYPNGDRITNTGTLLSEGRLSVTALTDILNTGTITGGLALQSAATPTVRLLAGTSIDNRGTAGTQRGDMLVQATSGVLATGSLGAAGTLNVTTGTGGIVLTAPISANVINLNAGTGDITQAANSAGISANTLTLVGGNAVLDGAGNVVPQLGTSTLAGELSLNTAGPLTVTGPVSAASVVLSAGGPLNFAANVSATRGLFTASSTERLAVAEGVLLTGGTGLRLTAPILTLQGALSSGGDLNLQATGGTPGEASLLLGGSATAAGSAQLASDGSMQFAGTLEAEQLSATAQSMGFDSAMLSLGRGGVLAAPGGFVFGTPLLLRPRDPARLPALVLEARQQGGLTALPDAVLPDTPGVPPDQQPTQIGQLGTPGSNAPAPLTLALDAGASPVFVLADAAAISGSVVAGRLGVLGAGGSAALSGTLGGLSDGTAASLASVTLATGDLGLAGYSFNGAVFRPALAAAPPPVMNPAPVEPTPVVNGPTPIDLGFVEAVFAALVALPVNPSVGLADIAASAGSSIAGPGEVGNGFGAGVRPIAQEPEALAELRAAGGSESADARNGFTRRFLPQPSTVRAKPQQGQLSDPDLVLPDAGGDDY